MSPQLIELPQKTDKDFELEKKKLEVAEKLYELFTKDTALFILLLLIKNGEISKPELIDKLKTKNKEEVIEYLNKFTDLKLVLEEEKRKSPLTKHYKISNSGRQLLKNVFDINIKNIDSWLKSYNEGKLKDRIRKHLYVG